MGQLGFNMVFDNRIDGMDVFVVVAPPDGTAVLALVRPEPETDEFKLVGRSRDVVLITEDIGTKYEEWRKCGVRFLNPPQKPPWGRAVHDFRRCRWELSDPGGFRRVRESSR